MLLQIFLMSTIEACLNSVIDQVASLSLIDSPMESISDTIDKSVTLQSAPVQISKNVNVAIGPQHFDLVCLVGVGAFGKVLLVKSRLEANGKVYAMKVISKKLLRKKNHFNYMKTERDLMMKLHHPFIVSLRFAFQSETKLFLVMDFLSGGELFFHLRNRGVLKESEARFYMAEMILGMYMYNNLYTYIYIYILYI